MQEDAGELEAQRVSDFDPPAPRQVVVEVKLLLQLQGLEAGVRLAAAAPGTPVGTCGGGKLGAVVCNL